MQRPRTVEKVTLNIFSANLRNKFTEVRTHTYQLPMQSSAVYAQVTCDAVCCASAKGKKRTYKMTDLFICVCFDGSIA